MEQRPLRVLGVIFSIMGGIFLALGIGIAVVGSTVGLDGYFFLALSPFFFVGLIFFVLGQVFVSRIRKKKRERDDLLAQGDCVMAKIVGVERNPMIRVNGRHPYRVRCRYEDLDGTVHEYRSWDLNYDPTGLFLKDTVDVYIDRYDPKRYYVDLERSMKTLEVH